MRTTAAVLVETGRPLVLADLDVPALKPGQVLVDVAFAGVCHTQLLESRGYRGGDPYLPHCLGHEGTGTVTDVGPDVSKVKAGDQVILSWIKGSGADVTGTAYGWNGRIVNAGAITTFGRQAVVSENRLTLLPDGVPMREAVMLGCAVPTGLGAVLNVASPAPGQSAVVFGIGGVGICAVVGAAIAGCDPIVACDIGVEKLRLGRIAGATHTVLSAETDVVEEVARLCRGGADFAIECTGRPETMTQALQSVRPRGGAAIIVGNARHGEHFVIDPRELNLGKRLLGTWGGESLPDRDYPRYAELIVTRRLDLGPLLSESYRLDQINDALDDLEAGRVLRPIIDLVLE